MARPKAQPTPVRYDLLSCPRKKHRGSQTEPMSGSARTHQQLAVRCCPPSLPRGLHQAAETHEVVDPTALSTCPESGRRGIPVSLCVHSTTFQTAWEKAH